MLSSCWDGHDRVHRLCVDVIRMANPTSAAIGLVKMRPLQRPYTLLICILDGFFCSVKPQLQSVVSYFFLSSIIIRGITLTQIILK